MHMQILRRAGAVAVALTIGFTGLAPATAWAAPTPTPTMPSQTPATATPETGRPAAEARAAHEPTFDNLTSTITIPDVSGLEYEVDGAVLAAGSHAYTIPFGGQYKTVTVRRVDGGTPPAPAKWTHRFPEVVEVAAPRFDSAGLRVSAPSHKGVQTFVDGRKDPLKAASWNDLSEFAGKTVRVYASAPVPAVTLLKGKTEWFHTFPAQGVAPTFDSLNSTITIPEMADHEYLIDGVVTPTGVHAYTIPFGGQYKTVTVRRVDGGTPPAPAKWTHRFPEVVEVKAPRFDSGGLRILAPSHKGVQTFVEGWNDGRPMRAASWEDMSMFAGKTVRVYAVAAVPAVTLLKGQTEWLHTFPARPDYSIERGDEFNGDGVSKAWRSPDEIKPSRGKSVYRFDNLRVRDGMLDVRISRHCLKTETEEVTDANKTEAVCPAGTITRYSSGRINSGFVHGAPRVMEVRAKLDPNHHGITTAAWMHNDQPFCNNDSVKQSDLGEFDTLEIWATDITLSNTHITCADRKYRTAGREVITHIPGAWHTWRMEWDGYAVRYYFDGVLMKQRGGGADTSVTGESLGLPQEKLASVINDHMWQTVINVQTPPDGGWAPWIDDSKPFPERHDLFDYVRVEPFSLEACAPGGAIGEVARTRPDLGKHLSCESPTEADGGRLQLFEHGRVYWHPETGAHVVTGAILDRYLASGGERAHGLPVAPVLSNLRDGGASQPFQRATVLWSEATGAHVVKGAIREKYAALGWENSVLGYPTGDEFCGLRDGGCGQRFQHESGHIYFSPASGAHEVHGAIYQRYAAMGWENGAFGYPISDEVCGLRDRGCVQRFQHESGHIYWSAASGAHSIQGLVYQRYAAMGWENSAIGYPISDEVCGIRDGGCFQRFQHEWGHIYWSPASGSWGVQGAIFGHYAANRWESGRFGYATGPEVCSGAGGSRECRQNFQGGQIVWSAWAGVRG